MKKWLSMICLTAVLCFGGCGFFDDSSSSSSNGGLGGGSSHTHADFDNDGFCDSCDALTHTHADGNGDGFCDKCDATTHSHADTDGNGKCDVCQASIQTSIDFYSINDLHGKFDDTYANIGVDEMTTYLRNAQTMNENTVVLSAGDMWQGSAESNFTKGKMITEWMNDLNFVAMSMGNHEFDWGESYIEQNNVIANFPFLALNIYDKATNERVDYCDASVIVEKSGVKIGVIGAIGDCYSSIAGEQVKDVYFKVGKDLTSLVKAESEKLRSMGADVIVYVLHDSGGSHYDESLSNGYVDLVFEGHTHTVVSNKDAYGVWHLQAGGDNTKGLSHAKVNVNILTGAVSVSSAGIVYHSAYESMADDPIVDTLMTKYASELSKVTEVLGTNAAYRNYDALANFAAKSLYAVGKARWGSDSKYAGKIVLGGGYLNVRSPYYLPAGQVTYGDIYPLFTFDNPVVLCSVSGSRLKSQFINSSNYYIYYGEDGQAIKNNVVDSETYYVVVDTYCAQYNFNGMGYLNIVEYYDNAHEFFTRDAVAEYIKVGGLTSDPPSPEGGNGGVIVPPVVDETYTSIASIHAKTGASLGVVTKGRVVAVGKTAFLFSDGTGVIMFYTGTTSAPTVAVGDEVEVSGDTSAYSGNQQFSATSNGTYVKKDVDLPAYSAPTPAAWGNAQVEAYDGGVGDYVTLTVSVYKSGSYYNCSKLSSSASNVVSLIPPTDEVLGGISITTNATEVVVTGYTCYIVSGKYVYIMADSIKPVGGSSGSGTASTLHFTSSFGGSAISEYSTGNYGSYSVGGVEFEYYRAYKSSGESALMALLPYLTSTTDGTVPGSLYNVEPIYGISSISITYKSSAEARVYTGDDRVAEMTAHALPASSAYTTKTLTVDADNFLKIDSGTAKLYIQALSVSYANTSVSYNTTKSGSGVGAYRLNATTYSGTLVAGQSAVSVPVKVVYDGGSYKIAQTKTYTYYTLEYVEANAAAADEAAMLTPQDVAAYYAAFKSFPANYATKNFTGNSWTEVQAVFGSDTRYVSKYDRTNGYATAVPYSSSNLTYYEFDIDVDNTYGKSSRGVGRVVSWEGGWDATGYNSAPVSVYTDDHYATFQEYLNTGEFGERFDAEMSRTFKKWSYPQTVTA